MSKAIVYTLNDCPNCRATKELLKSKGIPFTEKSMENPDILTELNLQRIFPMSAPVIFFEEKHYKYEEFIEVLK